MATLSWKRVGPGSGPANVLNGRYRVERAPTNVWLVRDLTTDKVTRCPGSPAPAYFRTMGEARRAAEDEVLRAEMAEDDRRIRAANPNYDADCRDEDRRIALGEARMGEDRHPGIPGAVGADTYCSRPDAAAEGKAT